MARRFLGPWPSPSVQVGAAAVVLGEGLVVRAPAEVLLFAADLLGPSAAGVPEERRALGAFGFDGWGHGTRMLGHGDSPCKGHCDRAGCRKRLHKCSSERWLSGRKHRFA